MHLKCVETESTFDYFRSTREYLEAYGKPVAFYSDKHAVFRVNGKGAVGGDGMTQFGRALHQLNIDIICANSPQAKGRVEHANGTLQDRLVKEMRLAGISTLEAGNAFLPAFMADFNRRFAKAPYSDKDLHRPLSEDDELDDVFAWREERTVSRNLTLQYDQVLFILEPNAITLSLARQRVTVYDYPDGRLAIKHKGLELPYRAFDRRQQVDQAAVVENKRLVRFWPTLPSGRRNSHEPEQQRPAAARPRQKSVQGGLSPQQSLPGGDISNEDNQRLVSRVLTPRRFRKAHLWNSEQTEIAVQTHQEHRLNVKNTASCESRSAISHNCQYGLRFEGFAKSPQRLQEHCAD